MAGNNSFNQNTEFSVLNLIRLSWIGSSTKMQAENSAISNCKP